MTESQASQKDTSRSLEELKDVVLDEALSLAPFDGWTDAMMRSAAKGIGAEDLLPVLYPDGMAGVLQAWSEREDAAMVDAFQKADPAPEKIREKITWMVRQRIAGLEPNREAARRAAATLTLPNFAPLGTRLTWATADAMWRALGDTSTDFNYYTKRTTLSAVYLSTLNRWFADSLDDESEPQEEKWAATWAFLDDRIENVMQFEKLKADIRKKDFSPSKLLGPLAKLRYGAGR